MTAPRTLRNLRKNAPPQDRDSEALRLNPPVPYERSPGSRYVKTFIFAQTLDQLRDKCGVYGEAAVTEMRWKAITAWLMNTPDASALSHPQLAGNAVHFCQIDDRVRLGYPHWQGKAITSPLASASAEAQAEARSIAADTVADWERAGCPYLTEDRIKTTHQYIQACFAYQNNREAMA